MKIESTLKIKGVMKLFDSFELHNLLIVFCMSLIVPLTMTLSIYCENKGIISKDSALGMSLVAGMILIFAVIMYAGYSESNRPKESILRQYSIVDPSVTVLSYDKGSNTATVSKIEKRSPEYVITENVTLEDLKTGACQNGKKEYLLWRKNNDGSEGIIVRTKCNPTLKK